jgi:hypothetical protein
MYDEGRSERELVRELRLTPEAVQVLHDKWLDGGGADRVLTSNAWETLERVVGTFKSITELVEHITQLQNLEKTIGPFKDITELVARLMKITVAVLSWHKAQISDDYKKQDVACQKLFDLVTTYTTSATVQEHQETTTAPRDPHKAAVNPTDANSPMST